MIVDAHVHLHPDRLAEAIRRWFDTHAWDIKYRTGVDESVRTLLDGGIDRMVSLPYVHKPGLARALNDFTLEVSRRHPEVLPCCTVFPGELGFTPRSWAEIDYPTLNYYHQPSRGGHFAAWEEPGLFTAELRAAFRSIR